MGQHPSGKIYFGVPIEEDEGEFYELGIDDPYELEATDEDTGIKVQVRYSGTGEYSLYYIFSEHFSSDDWVSSKLPLDKINALDVEKHTSAINRILHSKGIRIDQPIGWYHCGYYG